jgi:hypothetical protein
VAEEVDDLPKHLEFIQDIVDRHARTSFLLKGWSVTVVAAIFVLASRGADPIILMAAGLIPSVAFWGLDAFYLQQERMYRAFYDAVRKSKSDPSDRFRLDASSHRARVASWWSTMRAVSVFWFHAPVVLTTIMALLLFSIKGSHAS